MTAKKTPRATQRNDKRDPRGVSVMDSPYNNQEYYPKNTKNYNILPKTVNQERLIRAIETQEIVIAEAPAGCGKTYISGGMAAKFLADGTVDKIILTRANVHVGTSIGMLPGTIEEKMAPLLAPILSVLKNRMGPGAYEYNVNKKKIEMQPLEYIRGMSFADTFLIVDEAQNLSIGEIQALVTRFESGRILFIGDPFQTDIVGENGLVWLSKFSERHRLNYSVIRFGLDDIVRSGLVKRFLMALYADKGIYE